MCSIDQQTHKIDVHVHHVSSLYVCTANLAVTRILTMLLPKHGIFVFNKTDEAIFVFIVSVPACLCILQFVPAWTTRARKHGSVGRYQ